MCNTCIWELSASTKIITAFKKREKIPTPYVADSLN